MAEQLTRNRFGRIPRAEILAHNTNLSVAWILGILGIIALMQCFYELYKVAQLRKEGGHPAGSFPK